ncbi:group I truncated hemoglobin [Agitococcus lubricus]|uniref:Hemoglobin n=1 Tax=Agitococcus lubricus TaxID=1077255 RepID=A0A2T5IWX6_9GAMM|nr:group 1 truncated hemoglobin [Agitococcus lubricus]PTQ88442.1 hemoglobin [Agitococcus lubricus]
MMRLKRLGVMACLLCSPLSVMADAQREIPLCCQGDNRVFLAFGEREGIQQVMQVFMRKLMADERMRPFFQDSDRAKLVEHLTDQLCVVMGGGCQYQGRTMAESHQGQVIKREHFNALVAHLQSAMDERQIPTQAQHKVLAVLAPMYRQLETQ